MATILLSIKPEYADAIFAGTKKYEYRRHIASENVEKIIVYSTAPIKQVIGEVEVTGILSMKMTPLWQLTKDNAGISREKYRQYFRNSKCAFAYVLKNPKLYSSPKELRDYAINQPPQSFVYIKENKEI